MNISRYTLLTKKGRLSPPPDRKERVFLNGKKIDRSKAKGVCLLLAGAACLAVLALALSEPLMNLVKDPQTFRDWVSDKGI